MQLWHEGAIRKEGGSGPYSQYPTLSPSGLAHAGKPNGRAATLEDLEAIKAAFVKGALAALEIGTCGIEVHACHGYLLDQFLWAETNRRTDGYGGDDMAARVRFPAEIVGAIRSAVGPEFIISFRFSQWKEFNYQARIAPAPQDLRVMLDAVRAAGADIFHASPRCFWIPEWKRSDWGIAGWTKSMTDRPSLPLAALV